jgi:hypothetical protein
VLAVAGWIGANVVTIRQGVASVNRLGAFYTYQGWISDKGIRWIDNHSEGYRTIYSNEPELVYFHTGRHARRLPKVGEDLAGFVDVFECGDGALFIAQPLHLGDVPGDIWVELLGVQPLVQTRFSAVYAPADRSAGGGTETSRKQACSHRAAHANATPVTE